MERKNPWNEHTDKSRQFKIFSPIVLWKFCRNKTEKYKNSKMTLCSIRSILWCEYVFQDKSQKPTETMAHFCVCRQFNFLVVWCPRRQACHTHNQNLSNFVCDDDDVDVMDATERWWWCRRCQYRVQLCNQITIVSFSVASSTFCGVVHCMPFGLQSRRCHKMPATALTSHATIRCVMGAMYASSRPSKYIKINCAERYM